jgi:hypothetical protein
MNNYQITKVEGGYEVVDPTAPETCFKVTKPNGRMHCTCPDYRNAPKGTCDHIATIDSPGDCPSAQHRVRDRSHYCAGERMQAAGRRVPGVAPDPWSLRRPGPPTDAHPQMLAPSR